jgi:hypothetical protein
MQFLVSRASPNSVVSIKFIKIMHVLKYLKDLIIHPNIHTHPAVCNSALLRGIDVLLSALEFRPLDPNVATTHSAGVLLFDKFGRAASLAHVHAATWRTSCRLDL